MVGHEKVMETMHQDRHAIEHRLVMEQQQTTSELNGAATDGQASQEAICCKSPNPRAAKPVLF